MNKESINLRAIHAYPIFKSKTRQLEKRIKNTKNPETVKELQAIVRERKAYLKNIGGERKKALEYIAHIAHTQKNKRLLTRRDKYTHKLLCTMCRKSPCFFISSINGERLPVCSEVCEKRLFLRRKAQKEKIVARWKKRQKLIEKDLKALSKELSSLKKTKQYTLSKRYLTKVQSDLIEIKAILGERQMYLDSLVK